MILPLSTYLGSSIAKFSRPTLLQICQTNTVQRLGLRSQAGQYRQERIVTNKDGSVIVAWHPQPKFPYEMTRPVPRENLKTSDSKLKVQYVEDMQELYHHKHERLQRRDLMRLTWTSKHKWFPKKHFTDLRSKLWRNQRERPYL